MYLVYMLHGTLHHAPASVRIPIPMALGILIESTDQLPFCRAKWLWSYGARTFCANFIVHYSIISLCCLSCMFFKICSYGFAHCSSA